MGAKVEYFGIRHHGPGSARCLEAALEELQPSIVLIEGPSDASELLPLLADPDMRPPVALLAYHKKDATNAIFWPFAEYSPEYRAALWAHQNDVEARFIDLPAAVKLKWSEPEPENDEEEEAPVEPDEDRELIRDPLGQLAAAAGYEDGESWWSDMIEENPETGPVFPAIAEAMTALREEAPDVEKKEAQREAWMRIRVREAAKDAEGPVAVVCGAFHVPALRGKHTAKDDRALVRGLAKLPPALTWAPWTEPRLALQSGYGAGIRAPGWYAHLWEHRQSGQASTFWLLRAAAELRKVGHLASTASIIESERLATTLAALRQRPAAGFEELRDAAVSCLCFGERLLWETVARDLLTGSRVGEISKRTPLSPLMEDLKLQQKKAKLKPEALDRELSVDLRSATGLAKSTLLHRLKILEVFWGTLTDAGRSRGTFREKWNLRWEPELAVALVENLIHGPTIEQAAANRLHARMKDEPNLPDLAGLVQSAMTAQLEAAVNEGIDLLQERAAATSDCRELLLTLTPMADVLRYGQARGALISYLGDLMRQMALEAIVALPYAVRGLDDDATAEMTKAITGAHHALRLAEFSDDEMDAWYRGLRTIVEDSAATPRIAGAAARLLSDSGELAAAETAQLLERRLSPGTAVKDAAGYFEGFFEGSVSRLLYEHELRQAVDAWMVELPEESFVEYLPLFRRVFAALDANERKRLIEALAMPEAAEGPAFETAPNPEIWERHYSAIVDLLEKGMPK